MSSKLYVLLLPFIQNICHSIVLHGANREEADGSDSVSPVNKVGAFNGMVMQSLSGASAIPPAFFYLDKKVTVKNGDWNSDATWGGAANAPKSDEEDNIVIGNKNEIVLNGGDATKGMLALGVNAKLTLNNDGGKHLLTTPKMILLSDNSRLDIRLPNDDPPFTFTHPIRLSGKHTYILCSGDSGCADIIFNSFIMDNYNGQSLNLMGIENNFHFTQAFGLFHTLDLRTMDAGYRVYADKVNSISASSIDMHFSTGSFEGGPVLWVTESEGISHSGITLRGKGIPTHQARWLMMFNLFVEAQKVQHFSSICMQVEKTDSITCLEPGSYRNTKEWNEQANSCKRYDPKVPIPGKIMTNHEDYMRECFRIEHTPLGGGTATHMPELYFLAGEGEVIVSK